MLFKKTLPFVYISKLYKLIVNIPQRIFILVTKSVTVG